MKETIVNPVLNTMKSCLVVLSLLVTATYGFNGLRIDPTLSWRVVGGTDAPEGLYPHQISLQRSGGSHLCGGSIIDAEWIITAAHCVVAESSSSLTVVTGIVKLSAGGTKYKVLEVHSHEKYSLRTGLNDVAILKVEKIEFNDNVAPIAVEKNDVAGDVPLTLSGWGTTRLGGATPDHLQHVQLKSTTVEECRKIYEKIRIPIAKTQVCTFTKRGEGACHGDSGGPLIKKSVDSEPTLVGIVSWGIPCALGYPDVFGRVSSFVEWFNSKCYNCVN